MSIAATLRELQNRSPRRVRDLRRRAERHAGTKEFPVRMAGDVDVFRNDERGRPVELVHTSRPCEECGQPLVGLVVNVTRDQQVHAMCLETRRTKLFVAQRRPKELVRG